MPLVSSKAILRGVIIAFGGSTLAGLVIGFAVGAGKLSLDEMQSTGWTVIITVTGLLFPFLGGFVAGRTAKSREIFHAFVAAVVCVLFNLAHLAMTNPSSLFTREAGLVQAGVFLVMLLGARLARARHLPGD